MLLFASIAIFYSAPWLTPSLFSTGGVFKGGANAMLLPSKLTPSTSTELSKKFYSPHFGLDADSFLSTTPPKDFSLIGSALASSGCFVWSSLKLTSQNELPWFLLNSDSFFSCTGSSTGASDSLIPPNFLWLGYKMDKEYGPSSFVWFLSTIVFSTHFYSQK